MKGRKIKVRWKRKVGRLTIQALERRARIRRYIDEGIVPEKVGRILGI